VLEGLGGRIVACFMKDRLHCEGCLHCPGEHQIAEILLICFGVHDTLERGNERFLESECGLKTRFLVLGCSLCCRKE
jgi:hypothetical protein